MERREFFEKMTKKACMLSHLYLCGLTSGSFSLSASLAEFHVAISLSYNTKFNNSVSLHTIYLFIN